MTILLKNFDVLEYYDKPVLLVCSDIINTLYLVMAIAHEIDRGQDAYLCVQISQDRYFSFRSNDIDLKAIYSAPEMGFLNLGVLHQQDEDTVEIISGKLEVGELNPDWLPSEGYIVEAAVPEDMLLRMEATQRKKLVIELHLNDFDSSTPHALGLKHLTRLLMSIQSLVKYAYSDALRPLDKEARIPFQNDVEGLEVFATGAGSLTIKIQTINNVDLFGESVSEKALGLLDSVIFDSAESPEQFIERIKGHGSHFISTYKNFSKYLGDNELSINYLWTTPSMEEVKKTELTSETAKKVYEILLLENECEAEKIAVQGVFLKVDVVNHTWRIKCLGDEKRRISGSADSANILKGITIEKIPYIIEYEELITESSVTGKETKENILLNVKPLNNEQ